MDGGTKGNGSRSKHTARVNQAAGMVSVQANCGVEAALILMETRAAASRVTVDDIAEAVIDGSVRFEA